jgi:hypothetical protein
VDELGVEAAEHGRDTGDNAAAGEAAAADGADVGQPTEPPSASPGRLRRLLGLEGVEGTALRIWVLSRVAVFAFAWNIAWVTQPKSKYGPRGFGGLWDRWDWIRYQGIAAHGYSLRARHGANIAFFPGYPLILRAAQTVLRSWLYTGLIISFVAGAVAAVALARIIALEAETAFGAGPDGESKTRTAVREGILLWTFAPAAFFLAAGYTEAVFLAFALPAWLAARRGRWLLSGLLLAGATAIRVNGLFEFAAIALLFVLTVKPRGIRAWLKGSPLLIALVPFVAFMAYLHSLTGSWSAWHDAEVNGWNRHLTDPLHALVYTWRYAFGGKILPAYNAWEYQLELLAMTVGAALLLWLLWCKRWPEAVYVGASVVTLGTSHVYLSVPRELLIFWPLWAILGVWTVQRPWIRTLYLCISVPMMFTVSYLFLMGLWAG